MAEKRNITVALEPTLLKQARAVAARRGLSVSGLLAAELRRIVGEEARLGQARRRALALLDSPLPLGGEAPDREARHVRDRVR